MQANANFRQDGGCIPKKLVSVWLKGAATPYRVAQQQTPDLEFPDWSGQMRPAPSATMEDMHRLSLSLMAQRTLPPDFDERRLKAKVPVEFHL